MKNYVVWTNCKVQESQNQFGIEPSADDAVTARYDTMFQYSLASARKFLKGPWEPVVFTDPAPSRVEMFQANWRRLSDLWHSEPCNVLYLDSDTVFLKPTEIFGRWDEYRLFNWSTPPRDHGFENYFNAAVRYHPHTMSEATWQIGENIAKNWDLSIWDQEQIIFNEMFWSQGITFEQAHHPELNWQAPTGTTLQELAAHAQFNSFPIQHVRILHYHGTRSSTRGQNVAALLAKLTGVTL
jgi:hypothetical protein